MAHRADPRHRFHADWRWAAAAGFVAVGGILLGLYLSAPAAPPVALQVPATLPPQTTPAPARTSPAPHAQVYVVRLGDTLASISQRFYGTESDWRRIQRANASLLAQHMGLLVPGMELVIPLWNLAACCAVLPAVSRFPV